MYIYYGLDKIDVLTCWRRPDWTWNQIRILKMIEDSDKSIIHDCGLAIEASVSFISVTECNLLVESLEFTTIQSQTSFFLKWNVVYVSYKSDYPITTEFNTIKDARSFFSPTLVCVQDKVSCDSCCSWLQIAHFQYKFWLSDNEAQGNLQW